jgi:hypothetical protein
MSLSFNVPLNSVSFGQLATAYLREAYSRKVNVNIMPIGKTVEVNSQNQSDTDFFKWLQGGVNSFDTNHSRDHNTFKIWHLEREIGFSNISDNETLMTFYELDSPTEVEVNIAKNGSKNLVVTSEYTREVLDAVGVKSTYVPLGFDKANFSVTEKEYQTDGRIVFNLAGKFEFRKHHAKILKAWANKYGNNEKYALQCAIFNPFLSAEANNAQVADALGAVKYFNITFLPMMQTNEMYNDFLNSADIILGMSGGEGWGLPEFQSVCLGAHSVILNAHGYKGWANEKNSVLVEPSGKIECVDGHFFKRGSSVNQGNIFNWSEDDFISGCEEALKRAEASKVNSEGLKLQEEFSFSNSFDKLSKVIES